jgi:hypothetical protein
MTALGGWPPHQQDNDPLPFVVLPEVPSGRQEGMGVDLGQRLLAHLQREVKGWIASHNRGVKSSGCGVRIISRLLPIKSPWLNSMEPEWVHSKRKVVEPDGLLTAYELAERVAGSLTVRNTSTYPFPKMLPDGVLEGGHRGGQRQLHALVAEPAVLYTPSTAMYNAAMYTRGSSLVPRDA